MPLLKKTKQIVWQLLRRLHLAAPLQLIMESGLKQLGWFQSYYKRCPIDAQGKAIPWFTYSALHFLQARLNPSFHVFEYGSGYSTLYWAGRVQHVISVEHDPAWIEQLRPLCPPNVQLVIAQAHNYASTITTFGKLFDLIIIDGIQRPACLTICTPYLSPFGIMILDDSQRSEYQTAIEALHQQGFRRIDFWGMKPVSAEWSCTSIFYRQPNCLGI